MFNILRMLIIYPAFSLLIICPTSSFAWSGHGGGYGGHGGGYGRHGGYGREYWGSNFGYNISYWPDGFDYYNGVLVSPPVVETPAIIEPQTVVETPAIVTTPNYQTTSSQAANSDDNEITINAPNASGGYTSVVLKKSGNGFVGPQGEYYSQFPRVSQLSLMYGKT